MSQNRCIICGQVTTAALHILGRSICPHCESRILTTDAGDSQYDAFLNRLGDVSRQAAREDSGKPSY